MVIRDARQTPGSARPSNDASFLAPYVRTDSQEEASFDGRAVLGIDLASRTTNVSVLYGPTNDKELIHE